MKIGRNDPCPCGSGKKFKHCCIDVTRSADALQAMRHLPPALPADRFYAEFVDLENRLRIVTSNDVLLISFDATVLESPTPSIACVHGTLRHLTRRFPRHSCETARQLRLALLHERSSAGGAVWPALLVSAGATLRG